MKVQRENVGHFSKHSQNLYAGPMECARETVRTEGIRGLFKGGSVVFFRDNIGYLFYIPVYEGLSRYFRTHNLENTYTQVTGNLHLYLIEMIISAFRRWLCKCKWMDFRVSAGSCQKSDASR